MYVHEKKIRNSDLHLSFCDLCVSGEILGSTSILDFLIWNGLYVSWLIFMYSQNQSQEDFDMKNKEIIFLISAHIKVFQDCQLSELFHSPTEMCF